MIVLIDNYDSFTFNLVQILQQRNYRVMVVRNDCIAVEDIKALRPRGLVVSPGPGTPATAGICLEIVRQLGPTIPVLGVCLGHQAIAAAYGAQVVQADHIMHGKTSMIFHDGGSIFKGLANPFEAVRYHSLIVQKNTLPACLQISAWTAAGEIMGLRHRQYRLEGVQFHPESILTLNGGMILENFFDQWRKTS